MSSNILVPDPILLGKSQKSIPYFHSPISPATTKISSHKRLILNQMSDFSSPSNQGSFPFGSPHSTTSSINNSPPMKRKRGRPPKADSLTNRITSTMNISVNTSPLSNSPTAESNSNQITRRNNPDFYTSILKVSPTSKTPSQKKKRRSTSSQRQNSTDDFSNLSSPTDLSPNKKSKLNGHNNHKGDISLITPLSAAINGSTFTPYHQINSKTLDNISFITQSNIPHSSTSNSSFSNYNTPPSSTIKAQFDTDANQLYSPTPKAHKSPANSMVNPSSMMLEMNKNLLPPVSIHSNHSIDVVASKGKSPETKKKSPSPKTVYKDETMNEAEKPKLASSSSEFLLKLTVDDSGKAVLSNDFFQSLTGEVKQEELKSNKTSPAPLHKVDDNEYTTIKEQTAFRPKLTHANSVIGIEAQHFPVLGNDAPVDLHQDGSKTPQQQQHGVISSQSNMLRRHNSDFTGLNTGNVINASSSLNAINEGVDEYSQINHMPQLPQTPKIKDNFLFTSTGLTPSLMIGNNNLTFNLTPQFNSMMYSMMNINSPQLKRSLNNSQFLLNQDFFMNLAPTNGTTNTNSNNQNTINMTDLLSLGNTNPASGKSDTNERIQQDQTESQMAPPSSSSSTSNDESGDARLALKKIIHVKRK